MAREVGLMNTAISTRSVRSRMTGISLLLLQGMLFLAVLHVPSFAQGITSEHILRLVDGADHSKAISLMAPSALATSYSLVMPSSPGAANTMLASDASGVLSWSAGAPTPLSALSNAVDSNFFSTGLFPQTWTWNTLAGASALTINNGTLLVSQGLVVDTTTGWYVENAHTGTGSTNIGVDISVSGGSRNIGLRSYYGNHGFLLPAGTMPATRVHFGAGTATLAPLKFTSGTNLTTPERGAVEYDGQVFYTSIDTLSRGVLPSKYFVILDADNTLTNQTTAQPIFDGGGGSTNGRINLPTGLYEFEMLIHVTNLSATSGTVSLSFGGTATVQHYMWQSIGGRFATVDAPNTLGGRIAGNHGGTPIITLSNGATPTNGWHHVVGIIRISAAGTLIPQATLSVGAAAVVKKESYFKINKLGTNTAATVGRWK